MIQKNRKETNQILSIFPQMENITETQYLILEFLKTQSQPRKPKMISARLGLSYNSTRARLSELMTMGFIHQAGKEESLMSEIQMSGYCNVTTGKNKGYSILKLSN